ncbi:amidohydrolase [Olleya aquimaris]|uniref:Amidohydrolase family protein n=1 Tax=Olleya sediminilitoris TaxID=2795739 RepID=A0ABS1WLH8_9FLAO|nr:amidohydrolase family protein [Olleya sediminilitoris]AXO78885.1 amidohydrolase [Olleya aquimaris]MBL7559964.1 amidohydrolase family protein [Olleya sediminilitoris]
MKNRHLLPLFLLLFSNFLFAQTFITNVTIVDVEKQKLLSNQTVIITDNLISNIQKSNKIKVPENATIIDGSDKYLLPGLIDAHIHFFQNGGLYTRPDAIDLRKFKDYEQDITYAKTDMEAKLRRYLQNGITTVIDVGANYNFLKQRNDFTDKPFSPSIFITGPLLTTYEPKVYEGLGEDEPFTLTQTIEDGVNGVKEQLRYKPDFIKIWFIAGTDGLSLEESARKNLPIIKAIINEAHKNNLKVAVHATQRFTAQLAVENGADFLVHSVDDEILKDDFIQLMKKNKTTLCPTLIVHSGYLNTFGQKLNMGNYELQKADSYQLGSLLDLKHLPDTTLVKKYKNYANSPQSIASLKKADSISLVNLKILSDAGVSITTGTDAGNIGTLHASSYLQELQAMQKSGMSNWKIIQASTINGAKVFDKESEFGTVNIGKKANLILLDGDPIENIKNVTKINTIFNKGVIFKPDELIQDSPADLAQRQLNAYNFRNIDAFLEPYADDVEIYSYPDKLLYRGKEKMRKQYSEMFDKTPNLHCELKERIVQGNIVIDKERVRFRNDIIEAVAIYHIENDKIKKVYFIH